MKKTFSCDIITDMKGCGNMDIRLFITDLDGTLFGDNGDVSEANYRAMERMTELGCRVAISTGRTLGQIPVRLREHPSVDYII